MLNKNSLRELIIRGTDSKPVKNNTFAERVQATPTRQPSRKMKKDPTPTPEFEYLLFMLKNRHNSRNSYNNPAVTKDAYTKTSISQKLLTSALNVLYRHDRTVASYPTSYKP